MKIVCSSYLFSWIVSCILIIRGDIFCQYTQTAELISRKKKDIPLWWPADIQLRHEHRIVNRMCHSYIYESFWKENFHKDGFSSPHLFHFLSSSLLEYSWRSLAGQNVEVSISNRALVSIKSPGVSPKIYTFCQSLGRERVDRREPRQERGRGV